MTERRRMVIRFMIFLILAVLLAGFQTSFWYHLFGAIPPPILWLTVVVYFSLYRDWTEGLISSYLLSLALSVFTAMPEGLLSLLVLVIFFLGRFFRLRIFWAGPTYFMIVSGAAVPVFYIFHIVLSLYMEPNPLAKPEVLRWLGQTIETTGAAFFVFPLFQWIDELIKEENRESWSLKS
jgi:hypothetical protein